MLKKNLSIALVLSMILSLLGSSSAWASAPVVVDGADGSSITVNQWRYDKTFSAENTVEELEDDGFTFNYTPTLTSSGVQIPHKSVTVTYGPNGKSISGDYYFETQITREMNYYTFDFNHSADGYYRIEYGRNHSNALYDRLWVRLYKYDASTEKTHILVDYAKTSIASGLTRTYKVTVKTLEDGSLDINIGIYNGDTLEYTLAYTDTTTDTVAVTTTTPVVDENGDPVYEEDGTTQKTESVTENVDTGVPLTSGKLRLQFNSTGEDTYIKYLKAYSLGEVIEGTPVTYTRNIVDKTFSTADDATTAAEEGFILNNYYTNNDTYGIRFNSAAVSKSYFYYNTEVSGDYEFYTQLYRKQNGYQVIFNRQDDNNYYALVIYYKGDATSNNRYRLQKVINGDTIILDKMEDETAGNKYDLGHYASLKITISVDQDEITDDLDINITTQYGSRNPLTLSYKDTSTDTVDADGDGTYTDTGKPITSGYCRVGYSNAGNYGSCKIFRITQYETVIEGASDGIPVYAGKFSDDTGEIKEISKGNIYFEYPTAMFGNYKAVATLYEDYKMTGIKVIEPTDLYLGKVALFDTTNSTAEDIKIRVYFFDGRDNLKIVADEVYELN